MTKVSVLMQFFLILALYQIWRSKNEVHQNLMIEILIKFQETFILVHGGWSCYKLSFATHI